jgi:hypothetical protein
MRFLAEKGMAYGDELTIPSPDGRHPRPNRLMGPVRAMRTGCEPDYGPVQACHDCAVALGLRQSAERDGAPVDVA